jgi:hypothetical protein
MPRVAPREHRSDGDMMTTAERFADSNNDVPGHRKPTSSTRHSAHQMTSTGIRDVKMSVLCLPNQNTLSVLSRNEKSIVHIRPHRSTMY